MEGAADEIALSFSPPWQGGAGGGLKRDDSSPRRLNQNSLDLLNEPGVETTELRPSPNPSPPGRGAGESIRSRKARPIDLTCLAQVDLARIKLWRVLLGA